MASQISFLVANTDILKTVLTRVVRFLFLMKEHLLGIFSTSNSYTNIQNIMPSRYLTLLRLTSKKVVKNVNHILK